MITKELLKDYLGRPFKEFLKNIKGGTRISYTVQGTDFYGASGGSMGANQVPWYVADYRIVGLYLSKSEFYDYEIELVTC